MSQPPRLRDLINAARDAGTSYQKIAAKTGAGTAASISKSKLQQYVEQGVPDGKVPFTVPQLKALARAINQPWSVVKDAVLDEAGMTEVGAYDGAHIVVARAQEKLTPEEQEIWAAMAEPLIELIRRRRQNGQDDPGA